MTDLTKPASSPEPLAYRVSDAVRVSGLSKSLIYQLAAAGKINFSRIGRRTLVPRADLQRIIEEGRSPSA